MTDALVLQGVTKHFGELQVLKGIDMTVAEHEVICLIGASVMFCITVMCGNRLNA